MQVIDEAATVDLVIPFVADCVANRVTFTPYDITQLARAANPDTLIEHLFVRKTVRDYMSQVYGYSFETRMYTDPQGNDVPAITFVPDPIDDDDDDDDSAAPTPPVGPATSSLNTVPGTLDVGAAPTINWDL